MSKLFKLREWLTIPDTAKRLSAICKEEVTEADVYRLALDGHLTLSVNFVNQAKVKRGKIVFWEETDWNLYEVTAQNGKQKIVSIIGEKYAPPKLQALINKIKDGEGESVKSRTLKDDFGEGEFVRLQSMIEFIVEGKPLKLASQSYLYQELCFPRVQILMDGFAEEISLKWSFGIKSLKIDGDRYINLEDEITTIKGVWDLPMIGDERHQVEYIYQGLTGGAPVTNQCWGGCFVEKSDGQICQLQEINSYYKDEYKFRQPGSKAHMAILNNRIMKEGFEGAEAERLLIKSQETRKQFIKERWSERKKLIYYPAGELPDDCVLVVRTAALREFEQLIADVDNESTKNAKESPRKTDNLLRALTAIAIDAYGYRPELAKSTAPQDIAGAMSKQGFTPDPRTIREWLKEGANLLPKNPEEN